jgi:hypothetical protein
VKACAALAHENVARLHHLPAELLQAQPFRFRIAAVAGTAACFFVCHGASSLCVDTGDLDFGVPLAVALGAHVVLAAFELDDANLAGPVAADHLAFHRTAFQVYGAPTDTLSPSASSSNLVEHDFVTRLGVEQFQANDLALCHPVLLATARENRKHIPYS